MISIEAEPFIAARKASNFSLEDAARACDVHRQTYSTREVDPRDFKLGELVDLYSVMNHSGRVLLKSAIGDLFLD